MKVKARAVCCSMLQRFVVDFSLLQCVAVCCSVLQCVAVCCSVLQCIRIRHRERKSKSENEVQRKGSVLQKEHVRMNGCKKARSMCV